MEDKNVRVRSSRTFIRKVRRDQSYLSQIITKDETFSHYFEPKSKQASMDKAPSNTARNQQLDIDVFEFQRAIHSPYSPDLVPLDFAYFPKLKTYLRETRFNDRTEIGHAVQTFKRTLDRDWFIDVYENWVRRHHKCTAHQDKYFEKEYYVTLL
ncbi:hypothetical protein MAR_018652 [Mya arenaria]|uniref:Uncharacterized protein n=1 Tax=Mya arenaria TaxID=6604 RepID=A0ABY7EI28_MYAAR|nr:hypothetical protein MAR_018652 [Mya arenaria]